MAKTLILACTSYFRFEKNDEGDRVKRRFRRGDKIEVSDALAEALLVQEVGGRHLFVESEKDAEDEEANMPRSDVGANDPRATVPQGSLTSETKPASSGQAKAPSKS